MSRSNHVRAERLEAETQFVTNWPVVGVMAGLGCVVAVALVSTLLWMASPGAVWVTRDQNGTLHRQVRAFVRHSVDDRPALDAVSAKNINVVESDIHDETGAAENVDVAVRAYNEVQTTSVAETQRAPTEDAAKQAGDERRTATLTVTAQAAKQTDQAESKDRSLITPLTAAQQGRSSIADHELAAYLKEHVPELDFASIEGANAKLVAAAKAAQDDSAKSPAVSSATALPLAATEPVHPLWQQLADRPDLSGLPFRRESDCRADAVSTVATQSVSRDIRRIQSSRIRSASQSSGSSYSLSEEFDAIVASDRALRQYLNPGDEGYSEIERPSLQRTGHCLDAVPVLVQMLQVESTPVRESLIRTLATLGGQQATAALAQRALFDLSADVRAVAIQQLAQRPREESRSLLLEGLRYPWPAVADHAAAALAATNDQDAIPALIDLLDRTDPRAPQQDESHHWIVRELVGVNHLRNCYLCHAPSLATSDPIRGLVPSPGKPLPVEYYASSRGDFVRADVTYLRQDFSVMQPVADHGAWPERQRFDYFVRTREASESEVAAMQAAAERQPAPSYPQREAVLMTLRKLTGIDAGESSADWRKALAAAALPKHSRGLEQ